MAKFEYTAQHVAGKLLYAADALSRAPESDADVDLQEEAEAYVEHIAVPSLPATSAKLEIYKQAQKEDPICEKVREYCQSSWPKRDVVESVLKAYWKVCKSLTLCDDILLYNNRIVVPAALRKETLSLIHQGHQGVERSRARTKAAVWWPCVSSEVKQYVESCQECAKQSQL